MTTSSSFVIRSVQVSMHLLLQLLHRMITSMPKDSGIVRRYRLTLRLRPRIRLQLRLQLRVMPLSQAIHIKGKSRNMQS